MELSPNPGTEALLVMTTAESPDQALSIAQGLVQQRLAACVQLLPGVRSIYRWQDKLQDDTEVLLLIKTTRAGFEGVCAAIRELHSYELPEILALPVDRGDPRALAWINACVTPAGDKDRPA